MEKTKNKIERKTKLCKKVGIVKKRYFFRGAGLGGYRCHQVHVFLRTIDAIGNGIYYLDSGQLQQSAVELLSLFSLWYKQNQVHIFVSFFSYLEVDAYS